MLRLFLRVLLAFLALVGVFLLIGALLPRGYNIESSVVIEAPPSEVFPWVNRLQKWEAWSPISESRIDGLSAGYSGTPEGEGAIQTWTESRGSGKMWIENSEPQKLIQYKWRFDGFPDLEGTFEFKQVDSDENQPQCLVTWKSVGSLPAGPFYGYFGLIFNSAMTAEYQKSLDRLKQEIEKTN